MTVPPSTSPPPPQSTTSVENTRTGYNSAISLWIYEGTLIWNKFTAMVYANTILLITIGVIVTGSRWQELWILVFALCFLGIILCSCWYVLNRRSFTYYKYWILSARELEEQLLEPVKTVSRGGDFAENNEVTFKLKVGDMKLQAKGIEKWKIEKVVNVIICIFIVVYTIILLQYFPK